MAEVVHGLPDHFAAISPQVLAAFGGQHKSWVSVRQDIRRLGREINVGAVDLDDPSGAGRLFQREDDVGLPATFQVFYGAEPVRQFRGQFDDGIVVATLIRRRSSNIGAGGVPPGRGRGFSW